MTEQFPEAVVSLLVESAHIPEWDWLITIKHRDGRWPVARCPSDARARFVATALTNHMRATDFLAAISAQGPLEADELAELFHETYERLAPKFSYETREQSAVPWALVPAQNKALMTAVAAELLPIIRAREEHS